MPIYLSFGTTSFLMEVIPKFEFMEEFPRLVLYNFHKKTSSHNFGITSKITYTCSKLRTNLIGMDYPESEIHLSDQFLSSTRIIYPT